MPLELIDEAIREKPPKLAALLGWLIIRTGVCPPLRYQSDGRVLKAFAACFQQDGLSRWMDRVAQVGFVFEVTFQARCRYPDSGQNGGASSPLIYGDIRA